MTYEETIHYLYTSTPVFQHDGPSAYKPGLGTSIALDDYIPFVPQFVFIYILTFAFWCIAPLIIIRTGIGRVSDFFATAVISLIICGIFFLLLPATVTRPDIIPATAAERHAYG